MKSINLMKTKSISENSLEPDWASSFSKYSIDGTVQRRVDNIKNKKRKFLAFKKAKSKDTIDILINVTEGDQLTMIKKSDIRRIIREELLKESISNTFKKLVNQPIGKADHLVGGGNEALIDEATRIKTQYKEWYRTYESIRRYLENYRENKEVTVTYNTLEKCKAYWRDMIENKIIDISQKDMDNNIYDKAASDDAYAKAKNRNLKQVFFRFDHYVKNNKKINIISRELLEKAFEISKIKNSEALKGELPDLLILAKKLIKLI